MWHRIGIIGALLLIFGGSALLIGAIKENATASFDNGTFATMIEHGLSGAALIIAGVVLGGLLLLFGHG